MVEIGKFTTSTLFGRHIDETWIGDIDTTLSQTARTGEINLGKCVGFMSKRGSDGKIYKIPVYGE